MRRIVAGKRFDTATATVVTSDRYWDGRNWERSGRNQYLYRTRNGRYFVVSTSLWQGERDTLEPIDEAAARDLYEQVLLEHELEYEAAFPGAVVEDA